MTALLRVDSTINRADSYSVAVADTFQNEWLANSPGATVILRDLATDPIPYITEEANALKRTPPENLTKEQRAVARVASDLVDEVLNADVVVITAPLYNYSIPATLKSWIDRLSADPRAFTPTPMFEGKPALVVSARGGSFRDGTPKAGWDHAGPYLQHIFGTVMGFDVTYVEPELTMATSNPAMSELVGLHHESMSQALAIASTTAQRLSA